MIRRAYHKLKKILNPPIIRHDSTGERVDIIYSHEIEFETLDIYQKSHYRRYEFAVDMIDSNDICGDFACGTGYGTVMLSKKSSQVIGADINVEVITSVKKRYTKFKNIEFKNANLLDLNYNSIFNIVVSFETIEHFSEKDIPKLFAIFYKSVKQNGRLIFSTPYMQEESKAALEMGHHLTFYINEEKIERWLYDAGFIVESYIYQNYETHDLQKVIDKKDFILCVAMKN